MSDIRKKTGKKGATYQVRYLNGAASHGYSYKSFATRKEAVAFLENASSRPKPTQESRTIRTVEQALQKWLDVCEKEGRDGRDPVTAYTLKNYKWRRDHILKYGWTKSLADLAGPDMVEFRSWLLRSYSRDVAAKLLSSFHSMILEMIKRGVLARDILTGITIRGASRYDVDVRIPSEREVRELLTAADRLANSKNEQIRKSWQRYRPMLYLAADSGMRPQEYIVVPTFNIEDGGVKVDRALERGGGKISVTKTPAGRRFIDLSPETIDMVRHYAENFGPNENPHDLVFPTASGHWQSTDNWRKRGFYAACEAAGLMETVSIDGSKLDRPKYSPYDLRHFYASMLIEQRVNLKRLQKLMGHEKIETTLNVYGHLVERAESAVEKHTGLLSTLRSWIDADQQRAVHLAFDREKLMRVTRDFAREHFLALPEGYRTGQGAGQETLYERMLEKETGLSKEDHIRNVTEAWEQSDSATAFVHALADRGYILATGNRPYVLVDIYGGMHALSKLIEDKAVRTKEIRAYLEKDFPLDSLPSVDDAKALAAEHRAFVEQAVAATRIADRLDVLRHDQQLRRLALTQASQVLQRRQHREMQQLGAEQFVVRRGLRQSYRSEVETSRDRRRQAWPRGLAAFLGRLTGVDAIRRAVYRYQDGRRLEAHKIQRSELMQAQEKAREQLARRHEHQRKEIARKERALERLDRREQAALKRDVLREQRLKDRGPAQMMEPAPKIREGRGRHTSPVQPDFEDVARRESLRPVFNEAAYGATRDTRDDEQPDLHPDRDPSRR
jgi:integrase